VAFCKALSFEEAQKEVAALLKGRILVGHALKNDLECLLLGHPRRDIRDTSRHPEFRKLNKGNTPSLKKLATEILGITIQGGSHSSVCDAIPNPLYTWWRVNGWQANIHIWMDLFR
jgi:RNA exonuclease 4